ncbi:MAG: glycosyltransferase family 39 protein, partial [Chloroflexi bacterium]|nr:glycosyltransferase family 39 protein [Chloroflexota bacterium]
METDLRLVFALFAIPFGLFFGWPLVRRWLGEDDWLTASIATFGLSLGALSLWMFALSLVPRALSVWSILTLPAAVVVMTLAMGGRALAQGRRGAGTTLKSLTPDPSSIIPLLGVALPLAIITVNVLYYPFYYPDTLSRYGLFARRIFETRGLPESVQGYPLLVSLGYAWAFFAGGAVNDRLAGIVSAAFCAATIGVTFTLAREMYGRRAALAAAFLAATSTLFVVWGTSGYVDIPTGFFFALSALFAFRWLEGGPARNLWLAGLSSGLAIWTKQAGFIIVPSLVGVTVMSVLYPRGTGAADQRLSVPISLPLRDAARAGLIFIATITLVAGPWYLRNYLLSGPAAILPLPGSFYEAQADRRLVALFSFVTRPEEWGWTFALLGLFGLLYSLLEAVAGQWIGGTPEGRRRALFLLA